MSAYNKRAMVTLLPEWEPILDQLKREKFYNDSQAEMLRYLIGIGLASLTEKPRQEGKTYGDKVIY